MPEFETNYESNVLEYFYNILKLFALHLLNISSIIPQYLQNTIWHNSCMVFGI